MTIAVADQTAAPVVATCDHCTLPVPDDRRAPNADHQFCCHGCEAAWSLLHASGLDAYYRFAERRDRPVTASDRRFDELDHEAFQALYVQPTHGGQCETELYLEGVHCASCVWLVERTPLAVAGTSRIELDIARSLARVVWDPTRTGLAAIARYLDRLGYRPHPFRGAEAERLRRTEDRSMLIRIGVAGALAGNVMMLALALYAGWFGSMEEAHVRYFRWFSLALTTPVLFWPGLVFFRSAWAAIRARRVHMDIPIALALGAGFTRGAVNTVADSGPIYFDGVATLVFLLLVGRFLQQRAQRAAASSAELLHGLTPSTARAMDGGTPREIPREAVVPGMLLEIRGGETLAADGVVVAGESAIDLSLLTGESHPAHIGPGDAVFAGTVNHGGTLSVRVTQAGEASRLGRLLADLEASSRRRGPMVTTADRLAGWFVAIVIVLAAATWLIWRTQGSADALDNAIALLIVTCPCALALATPLSITSAIGRAAREGILIRGGDALEALARPGLILIDKTGTITKGRLALEHWTGPAELREHVLGIEAHSSHPLATAFREAWPDVNPEPVDAVELTLGGGLTGQSGGRLVAVGAPRFILARASDPSGFAHRIPSDLTPVLVARDGVVVGAAGFGDPVRPDSASALDQLRRRGWEIRILSGDDQSVVQHVAAKLAIPAAHAIGAVLPEDKLARVEAALAVGPVIMIGDGVNDAPAIARATVGISVHGGAEASLAAADVYLAREGLAPVVDLVEGAGRTLRVIRRTIGLSICYNLVGATLAITGRIDPLIAAVLMPASSLSVILIAWRSRTFGKRA